MKNLDAVLKVMKELDEGKQKLMVDFKEICLVNAKHARSVTMDRFYELPIPEQMRVLYALEMKDELNASDINSLSVPAKLSLIQRLIVDEYPEMLEELEEYVAKAK